MDDRGSTYDWVTIDRDPPDDDPGMPTQPRRLAMAIKFVLALATFFLLWAYLEHRRSIEFERSAVETVGTIADKWVHRYWHIGRQPTAFASDRYRYYVVSFKGEDGIEHRYRNRATWRDWNRLRVGSTFPVFFVPADPGNFALYKRHRPPMAWLYLFLSAGAVVIAGWLYFEWLATRPSGLRFFPTISDRIRQRKERRAEKLRRAPSIYRPMI